MQCALAWVFGVPQPSLKALGLYFCIFSLFMMNTEIKTYRFVFQFFLLASPGLFQMISLFLLQVGHETQLQTFFAARNLFIVNYGSLRIVYCKRIVFFCVVLIRTVNMKLYSSFKYHQPRYRKNQNQSQEVLTLKVFALYMSMFSRNALDACE